MKHFRLASVFGIALIPCAVYCFAGESPATRATQPAVVYETKMIEGWTVHIHPRLRSEEAAATEKALDLLSKHLREICRVVPREALARLKTVPLWINPQYPHSGETAEYHPDGGWLRANGRNPDMAHCVEFSGVRSFEAETRRMPCFVLHELAHAYHDQVLGFDQPDVIAAYEHAVESKSYDAVERTFGDPNRPNAIERAYAMTNHKEYFSECTEAYFGRNDFFPFDHEELRKHDPQMFDVLTKLWGVGKDEKSEPAK